MLGERKAESERHCGATARVRYARTLAGKPLPHGDTNIDKNGLAHKELELMGQTVL